MSFFEILKNVTMAVVGAMLIATGVALTAWSLSDNNPILFFIVAPIFTILAVSVFIYVIERA